MRKNGEPSHASPGYHPAAYAARLAVTAKTLVYAAEKLLIWVPLPPDTPTLPGT
jgi:hypothetical protein